MPIDPKRIQETHVVMNQILFLLALTVSVLTEANHAVAAPICNNETICALGAKAEQTFFDAWKDGDWSDFRALLKKDDVVFQFPDGPFKGRSEGKDGYDKINQWISHHMEFNNRIHSSKRNLIFGLDDWYYFADEAVGNFYGQPYIGSHFIGFRFKDGKIVEYREYVGDLTHWK